ncbi:MAG: hypothetical protein WC348_03665 [Patescibacteria group bacterium]|jgi:hypothetical protein
MPREHSFSEIFGDEFKKETKTPEELALEKEEEAAREKKHREAAKRYEESLQQPSSVEEAEIDKKTAREDVVMAETNRPSGKDSRRTERDWERGHRKGLKPIKRREAA